MTSPLSRLLRPPTPLRRWALPTVLAVAAATEAAVSPLIADGSGMPAVFAFAMALPLGWRQQLPARALAGTVGIFVVQELFGPGTLSEAVLPFLTLVVAMYSAGARLRGVRLLLAGLGCALAIVATIMVDARGSDPASTVYALVVVVLAFVAGRLLGDRAREVSDLADANETLRREREEQERAAVARERMRIARELHDLITHRVSAMVLQASAERRILQQADALASGQLATTLESIEGLGREALSELRHLLGALHHEGAGARAPQPGVDRLPELVEQSARAGLSATFRTTGCPRDLPRPVDVSVYRLAQECLANAMRHAPGSEVRVDLRYLETAIELSVRNSAGAADRPVDRGLGLGLTGMRERAHHFGGTLDAGPTADGGFDVHALLPVPAGHGSGAAP
jgi:signal transduction histidine kinase